MNKKVVIGVIAVFVLVIIGYFIFRPTPYYSDNPKHWIDDKPGNVKEINIDKVTKGAGYEDPLGIQWNDGEIITVFGHDGLYNGNYFEDEYADDQGKVLMRITPRLKANDGIIDGYIVERIQGDKLIAYLFLDDDYRKKVGTANIIFGQNNKIQVFDFSQELRQGVYMNELLDDRERFDENYKFATGGVIVTNANLEDVRNGREEGIYAIRIY